MTELCTVERKCSAAGKACGADDRACQNQATSDGLEITCERGDPHQYVYCPPGGSQRDSGFVWVLLLVAVAVAIVGGIVAVMIFRRATRE